MDRKQAINLVVQEANRLHSHGATLFRYEVWQDRPYTGVKMHYIESPDNIFFGFTKVCYPDKWDPDCGVRRALRKAASKIIKEDPDNLVSAWLKNQEDIFRGKNDTGE
jgi:hypothetical protein